MGHPRENTGRRRAQPVQLTKDQTGRSHMFVVIGGFLGAILGGLTARRRKGNRADIAQYAVVYAMGFALIGLFVTIFVHRMSL